MSDIAQTCKALADAWTKTGSTPLSIALSEAAAEIERLRPILEAARLYDAWEKQTHDYPHDEQGCVAHEALLKAVRDYEQ